MMRLFNIREGFTAADDKLPARFFQPKTDGYLAQAKPDAANSSGQTVLLFVNGLGSTNRSPTPKHRGFRI